MDDIELPSRYHERFPHFENRPPLTDEEARHEEADPICVIEDNKKIRYKASLVQVYKIRFFNCLYDPQTIFGRISMGLPTEDPKLFDRESGHFFGRGSDHDISPQGVLRLNGPKWMSVKGDTVYLYYEMFRKNEAGVLIYPIPYFFEDGEKDNSLEVVCIESDHHIDELTYLGLKLPYNKILTRLVHSTCGLMELTYSIFRDGADCFVSFKLLKWGQDKGQTANIYGTVRASSTMLSDPEAESLVLDLKRDEHIAVRSGQFIPLHRPITVVPMGYAINFDFCIMHRDKISGKDVVVVEDVVRFEPQCWFKSSQDKYITDYVEIPNEDFALVEVKVYWCPWWVNF